jgi:hypothetical protein
MLNVDDRKSLVCEDRAFVGVYAAPVWTAMPDGFCHLERAAADGFQRLLELKNSDKPAQNDYSTTNQLTANDLANLSNASFPSKTRVFRLNNPWHVQWFNYTSNDLSPPENVLNINIAKAADRILLTAAPKRAFGFARIVSPLWVKPIVDWLVSLKSDQSGKYASATKWVEMQNRSLTRRPFLTIAS